MNELDLVLRLAVALGLGIFIGLQRERTKKEERGIAGVRTFGLIALTGAVAGFLQIQLALPWLAVAVFLVVAALAVASYVVNAGDADTGATPEVSAILVFLIGILCAHEQLLLAAVLGVATTMVLALREWLHTLAKRIATEEVEATIKFAIIALVVLPLVPNENYGPEPLDVINPYKIWLMVVLISGVDFASYVLIKIVGTEHGIGLTGVLGGLMSSTAITLGFAKQSKQQDALSPALALGILLAWTVMFVRIVVIASAIAWPVSQKLIVPILLPTVAALISVAFLWRRAKDAKSQEVDAPRNPFDLWRAVKFGLIFGAVTFVAKAAQVKFGEGGLYVAGALAGTTDVDAITLSMAQMGGASPESLGPAARTIEIAALSNTLVKGGLAVVLGSAGLRRVMLPAVAFIAAASVAGILISRG
jgi:uncharacterized membrane protein (DUF4010 family)